MILGKKKLKHRKSSFIIWVFVLLLLLTVSLLGSCQTQGDIGGKSINEETLETEALTSKNLSGRENSSSQVADQDAVADIVVYLTVNSANAVNANLPAAAPYASDGIILFNKELSVKPGSTVFDVLKASGCIVNASNSFLGTYISAIQGINSGAVGGSGGWIFSVNGSFPQTAASNMVVKDKDYISFHYTIKTGDVAGSPY